MTQWKPSSTKKMKPTIEPNQDKITTYNQIISELPNESITLIPNTWRSAPSHETDYITNDRTTLMTTISPIKCFFAGNQLPN